MLPRDCNTTHPQPMYSQPQHTVSSHTPLPPVSEVRHQYLRNSSRVSTPLLSASISSNGCAHPAQSTHQVLERISILCALFQEQNSLHDRVRLRVRAPSGSLASHPAFASCTYDQSIRWNQSSQSQDKLPNSKAQHHQTINTAAITNGSQSFHAAYWIIPIRNQTSALSQSHMLYSIIQS